MPENEHEWCIAGARFDDPTEYRCCRCDQRLTVEEHDRWLRGLRTRYAVLRPCVTRYSDSEWMPAFAARLT